MPSSCGPLGLGRLLSRKIVSSWYRFHLFSSPFSNRPPVQGVMPALELEFAGRRKVENYASDCLVAGRTNTN